MWTRPNTHPHPPELYYNLTPVCVCVCHGQGLTLRPSVGEQFSRTRLFLFECVGLQGHASSADSSGFHQQSATSWSRFQHTRL